MKKVKQQSRFLAEIFAANHIKNNLLQALSLWIASLLTGLIAVSYEGAV
jgi:lipid-A-disaccharide synthase-like uncharacterized protein